MSHGNPSILWSVIRPRRRHMNSAGVGLGMYTWGAEDLSIANVSHFLLDLERAAATESMNTPAGEKLFRKPAPLGDSLFVTVELVEVRDYGADKSAPGKGRLWYSARAIASADLERTRIISEGLFTCVVGSVQDSAHVAATWRERAAEQLQRLPWPGEVTAEQKRQINELAREFWYVDVRRGELDPLCPARAWSASDILVKAQRMVANTYIDPEEDY